MKRLNDREIEVIGIILAAGRPITSSQIVKAGQELTQSTVQAAIRKLLEAGCIEVQGTTYSGNVLSRTFVTTAAVKQIVLNDFVQRYRKISAIISLPEAVSALRGSEEKECVN